MVGAVRLTSITDPSGLAEEQAALRQVATLVASQCSPQEVFTAVTEVVGPLLDADLTAMHVFANDGTATTIAGWSATSEMLAVGTRLPLEDDSVAARIFRTGAPARIDNYVGVKGDTAEVARGLRLRSTVGAPIVVAGKLWGALMAATRADEPFAEDVENRIATFTELVATAISNAEARQQLERVVAEQRALRAAATLVAGGASSSELFMATTTLVSELLDAPFSCVVRVGQDNIATMVAGCPDCSEYVGTTWVVSPDDTGVTSAVLRSQQPERVDDHSLVQGPIGEAARALGVGSVVGAPVIVDGVVWGVLVAGSAQDGPPLPADAGDRLLEFTELLTTSLINAETRDGLRRLADTQTSLRRIATLVADEVEPDELFSAVSDEVARLFESDAAAIARFESDGSAAVAVGLSASLRDIPVGTRTSLEASHAATEVYRTGRAARKEVSGDDIHDPGAIGDMLRGLRFYSTAAAPIVVAGRVWGALVTLSARTKLPQDTEERLEKFGELVATAISNAEGRRGLANAQAHARGLADEQAALRRVATLVAEGVNPDDLFLAVSNEVASLFDAEIATIGRFDHTDPPTLTAVGLSDGPHQRVRGVRSELWDWLASTAVYRTGLTSRKEVTSEQVIGSNELANMIRALGFFSTVSTPIRVEGELWGVLTVSSSQASVPAGTEMYIESFGELVATAIANAQNRGQLSASEEHARALADEQGALRRVATLVAQGVVPSEILAAVSKEVQRLFRANPDSTVVADLIKFEGEEFVLVGASRSIEALPLGSRWRAKELYASTRVLRTGRSARVSESDLESTGGPDAEFLLRLGYRTQVASPIVVEGRLWGVVTMNSEEELPPDTEERLAKFAELVATAIANTESREAVARLAEEQAALRRVATLVAQGAEPARVFAAVAGEAAGISDISVVGINRYEADGTLALLGLAGEWNGFVVGSNLGPVGEEKDGVAAMILNSGTPARFDVYRSVRADATESEDLKVSTVGVPIVVDGTLWGFIIGADRSGRPIPVGVEDRLARFTELVAAAVSNATTHSELLTSRARLVSAADQTRRRLERDLHDGIQQWIVALALKARNAARVSAIGEAAAEELSGLADDLVAVTDELREISRGIHPTILSDAGLDDALEALARRSAIPVDLEVSFEGRFDASLEATAYYVTAESITNAVKHAQASVLKIRGGRREGTIELEIRDDGVGGADPRRGTGLIGLKDRVDTLGGTISVFSPAGGGTIIRVKLPDVLNESGIRS